MIVHKPRLYRCPTTKRWTLKQEHVGPVGFVHTIHPGFRAITFDSFEDAVKYISGKDHTHK